METYDLLNPEIGSLIFFGFLIAFTTKVVS